MTQAQQEGNPQYLENAIDYEAQISLITTALGISVSDIKDQPGKDGTTAPEKNENFYNP